MAASLAQSATSSYVPRSSSSNEDLQRPHTPPIPYFHSPFNHCATPPVPLNFSGGPLVLTDSAVTGGSPSFQRAISEHPVSSGSQQTGNIRLSIAKHRWKEVTDFTNGNVPVIEIRPYNKCDGKRYIYVRVDNIASEPINLKARFRLRKASGEWLGYLTRSTTEIIQDPGVLYLSAFDVDVTGNLTLLISEPILRKLDCESNSGRNSNMPAEQELQIVVSTTQRGTYQEIAVLPFFRVKRKHKRSEKQIASEPIKDSLQFQETKRPRTLSSEKHHPIPSLSGISAPIDLNTVPNAELDSESSYHRSRDMADADSFLALNVEEFEQNPARQCRISDPVNPVEDHDCEEIMNFVPPPNCYDGFDL